MMTSKKNWIAYVGPFSFPWGQAGSRRVCGVTRSIADAGNNVVVCSGDSEPLNPVNLNEGEALGSITYVGLSETPLKGIPLSSKLLQLFILWGKKTVNWLDSQTNKPSHVIVYGGSAQYIYHLLPWCQHNNIPLIVDIVEWYDPKQMTGGFFGPFHISAKIALHYYYPKCNGAIVISSYLAKHYRKHGVKIVTVPPSLDVINHPLFAQNKKTKRSRLTLVYAGTPGKKDLLSNVINGINQIDPNGEKTLLLVMGPTLEQIKQLLNASKPPVFVQALGRIPQNGVAKIIQQADFSVLLREPLRFTEAGFPTKFVESMANGTPVIANLTSDLDQYLFDGINGFVCRDHSAESFSTALQQAINVSSEKLYRMRQAARKEAEQGFDYRNHTKPLKSFLKKVKKTIKKK